MFKYSCVCGKSEMAFKFNIGGPFTGECCGLAELEALLKGGTETPVVTDEVPKPIAPLKTLEASKKSEDSKKPKTTKKPKGGK